MKTIAITLAAIITAAAAVYVRWVRRWHLRWGATDEEVAMAAPGDDLVAGPHIVATRAITIQAPPAAVWPWLIQMGRDRAGWYSYDRLDNEGKPSAWEILPEYQHMEVGDVVAMGKSKGKVFGPIVLSVDEP